MHPLGAAAQFTRSLRTAQQQYAENGSLPAVEVEDFLEPVLILGDAAVGTTDRPGEALFLEPG